MRLPALLLTASAGLIFGGALAAQAVDRNVIIRRGAGGNDFEVRVDDGERDSTRAWLGLVTGGGASKRDTLGLVIRDVAAGSPAEKAGLEEGQRLAAINGVSLRASVADAEDPETSSLLYRRLVRELRKAKAGDEVELQVYADGRTKSVKVKTASPPEPPARRSMREWREERMARPSLGVALGGTPSKRDAEGIFVSGVTENGPADKAGIIEGERLQAINGQDLRIAKEDAGDGAAASAKVQRLRKALDKVKAGDEVELKVWSAGRVRTVKVKTAKASELAKDERFFFFNGGEGMPPMPPMPPMPALGPMFERLQDLPMSMGVALDRARLAVPRVRMTREPRGLMRI